MNCDQAFELLTDPVGSTSPALQRHLDHCPRCHQMQQTLSPALDWMRSSVHTTAGTSGYSGSAQPFLSEHAVLVAEQAARRLPRRRSRGFGEAFGRAALIAGVALFGVLAGAFLMEPRTAEAPSLPAGTLAACLWEQPQLRQSLSDATARGVVVSCVVCHVPPTIQ